ncbi:MAG: HAMP domain-containing histidine kinase [Saprospiraceae bacterium]|nr:HAMP domain-containing histidine kinase [Saprospiraceae bacterium]
MSNSSIWKVVISAALSLICIVIVQGYWLKKSFDYNRQAFEEKVHISLRNVAKQISVLQQVQLPSYDLINQVAQNYYIVNIRDAIDANSLEFYLQKEFEVVGLNTDFEYGIYDCDTDQMVYGNYISRYASPKSSDRAFRALPTHRDFVYYFGVRFPNQGSYILTAQWLPIFFSIILLLSVLFFTYATFEILRQKKMSDLQKDFINNMTHEFKTPLSSIKVSSEVLINDPRLFQYPRLQEYAKIVQSQSKRLNDHVERLLQIADFQKGKIHLKRQLLALDNLINMIVEQLEGRAVRENATISTQCEGSQFIIFADRHHLSNVIYNLVDNALKYRRESANIVIKIREEQKILHLLVQDNGIGIRKMYLNKLDQKFFRVPTGNVHNTKGFGLGLHYVRQIVDAHKWSMEIKSEPAKGTIVEIKIPKVK